MMLPDMLKMLTDNARQFQERLTEWQERGYQVKGAKVRFIVAWKPKDAPKTERETAVLLVDLAMSR